MSVAIPSRRAFIAAASAASLPFGKLATRVAEAQENGTVEINPDLLTVLRARFELHTSEGFGAFFREIWQMRILLSLASVERAVEEDIEAFLEQTIDSLRREFSERIPDGAIDRLIVNAVRLQDTALGFATETRTGYVRIERGLLERASAALCPLYPFC